MPRQLLEQKDFTFVGGLNTEAGYLTFPPNTWLEGDNMEPKIDGSIGRRVAIDFETGYEMLTDVSASEKENMAFSNFLWKAVAGNGDLNFVVVQLGRLVKFIDTTEASLTPNLEAFYIDLSDYRVPTSPLVLGTSQIRVAVGNGKLIIVSEQTDPILVEYLPDTDDITVSRINLQIRDFDGLDDDLDVDERPTTLSDNHKYNLLNQGWDTTKIASYFSSVAVYPSNAQIWTVAKDATDDFDPTLLDKQFFGTTKAPNGRFVLDLFNKDRGAAALETPGSYGNIVENYRPTTTAFFAGRVWYSGIKSTKIGSNVYFSQIVQTDDQYGKCFQEGDPTSEYGNDLLETDGGGIPIPEAGGIVMLLPIQNSLIVFANNGIWQIAGGDSNGFVATGYRVNKITAFGCVSASSVVEVENTAIYWSPAGIFALKMDTVSGSYMAESISFDKIQTMYSAINDFAKRYSSGFYNDDVKKVLWMYSDELEQDTTVDRFKKNRMLILDIRLSAFYSFTIAESSPFIVTGIHAINRGINTLTYDVVVNDDPVVSNSGADSIIATIDIPVANVSINKFLTVTPPTTYGDTWGATYSDFTTTNNAPEKWMDWYTFDVTGVEPDPLPYIATGYKLADDGMKNFQAPYIIVYMRRTEDGFEEIDEEWFALNPSSVMMQGKWEWTDSASSNRWTTAREVYRHRRLFTPETISSYDDGYPLVVTKNKLLGKGHALSIKYTCSAGKDAQIVGWAIQYTKNTNV